MANYQSLKAAINAVIKANGNKEITGTVLNEVLLAMVNSLGAGYQFAGVATPSTNPGTPDQKVFYIASQAGTYTNFNGAVVSDGIAIFEWNGTWTTETLDLSMAGQVQSDWTETDTTKKSYIKHKPNIPPSANVDPVPTNGSPNAVASGGVYNAIKAITDFLNNGYYFVGIAGTSTVPDSVTQYGIFYIASDGGTYTNFLNGDDEPLTLYQGLNILYKDVEDDGWNYFEVFKFSDFVDTTQQQTLSSAQKAQARTNIAAVSYDQQSLSADQQVQAQNNMIGKAYNAEEFSGLGKKVLAKNIIEVSGVNKNVMMQSFFNAANTVYVIQYDYTLGENITIPDGCTLEFDGGSIKAGGENKDTITGDFKIISSSTKIFDGIKLSGYKKALHSKWFCYADETHDDSSNLQNLFDSSDNIIIDEGVHRFTSGITISNYVELSGNSPHNKYSDCVLYYDNTSGTAFSIGFYDKAPYYKIKGLYIKGKRNPENYYIYYEGTTCIDSAPGTNQPCLEVEDCHFENFEYIFNSNHNSYYNSFTRVRANSFNVFCNNFDANNFNAVQCRIQEGKIAFYFLSQSGGDGPVNIDKCSLEQVMSVLVSNQQINKINITNNYIEITDKNIPISKENAVIYGSIANVCSIGNELQVNSVFRPYYLSNCKCFVSIGNHISFNLSNTKVDEIYSVPTGSIEVFIAEDNFTETPAASIQGAEYQAYSGVSTNLNAPGNAIVQAIDPVSKKRFSWEGKCGERRGRPTNVYKGYCYLDETLNKPIWWTGDTTGGKSGWVDATGADSPNS